MFITPLLKKYTVSFSIDNKLGRQAFPALLPREQVPGMLKKTVYTAQLGLA